MFRKYRKNKELVKQIKISFPTGVEYSLATILALVDTASVLGIGPAAISLVGAMAVVINFVSVFSSSVAVTNGSLTAHLIGAKKYKVAKRQNGAALIYGLVVSIITCAVTILLSEYIVRLFSTDASFGQDYLNIRAISLIPAAMSLILSGFLRVYGKTKTTMILRTISLAIKIILNIIFIKLGYGVAGIAWAGVIADILISIGLFIFATDKISFMPKKDQYRDLITLSWHNAKELIATRLSRFLFNIITSSLGKEIYSVHTILSQTDSVFEGFAYGLGIGATNELGSSIGAKNKVEYNQRNQATLTLRKLSSIILSFSYAILMIFIIPFITTGDVSINLAYSLLPLVVISAAITIYNSFDSAKLRAFKDFKYKSRINGFSFLVIKIPLVFVLSKTILGIHGVWLATIISSVVFLVMMKRRIEKLEIGNSKNLQDLS